MPRLLLAFLLLAATPAVQAQTLPRTQDSAFVKANYTKLDRQLTMRDGVKLYTVIYVPKDASAATPYPFLMTRTPYSAGPYGEQKYRLRGVDRYGASWWDEDAGALRGMPLPKDCSVAAQQALVSQYKEQGTELPLPGCYSEEKDFAKAPEAYLTFMRQHWFALMQKQDTEWSQTQTQPQDPVEDDDTAP